MKIRLSLLYLILFIHQLFSQGVDLKLVDIKGNNIIFTNSYNQGIYLYNSNKNETLLLNNIIGGAYRASFPPSGKYIAFKNIELRNDISYQTPMLFDIDKQRLIPLTATSSQAGVPSFSKNGDIALTVGKELFILDSTLTIKLKITLSNYVNLPTISPDGKKLILNDDNDQLYILDILNLSDIRNSEGSMTFFTDSQKSYYEPIWSEDGEKITYKSLSSEIYIYDIRNRQNRLIGRGYSLSWDNDDLYFIQTCYDNEANLISSKPMKYNSKNKKLEEITDLPILEGKSISTIDITSLLLKDKKLLFTLRNSENVHSKNMINIPENENYNIIRLKVNLDKNIQYRFESKNTLQKITTDKFIPRFDSVYFHQVYDCRWDRSGVGWGACGAASSLMGLMFYRILPEWGSYSYQPSYHYSPFANYLTEIYTYNGVTYNIAYSRGSGSAYTGYGIYGWIYRNSLEDTRGHMAELLKNHGLSSEVDWSYSWGKVQQEINQGFPFVLLNSLTSAGHYTVWTGYDENRSGIFNDPYGNKNLGTYPNYYGKRAKYDWPGYSNGYSNLNTVWCFIYMRGGADVSIISSTLQFNGIAEDPAKIYYKIGNIGSKDVSSPFKVKIFLSDDNQYNSSDSLISEKNYNSVPAGHSIDDSASCYLPKTTETKTYYIFIRTDADNQLSEVTKINNYATLTGTVIGKPTVNVLWPYPNSTATYSMPAIYIAFDTTQQIDTFSIILKVNNIDVTPQTLKWNYKLIYYTPVPYVTSEVSVYVYLRNKLGYDTSFSWSFKIPPTNKVTEPTEISEYHLSQNYPNPFNPSTNIEFQISDFEPVTLKVYDYLGKEITTLINEKLNPGNYNIKFNAEGLTSGIYFYRLLTSKYIEQKKMLLIK